MNSRTKTGIRSMKKFLTILMVVCFAVLLAREGYSAAFKKKTIFIGHEKLEVEIADNEELRERGLMNRSSLGEKEGMLFIFPAEMKLSFWMKNTLIPLSIGFFKEDGKLIQVLDMEPASPVELEPKIYLSAKPSKYALEVARGWFSRKKIKVGDVLKMPPEPPSKKAAK
jgi:uncharacterized protein